MEYGEKLTKKRYWWRTRSGILPFRYRIDPVPLLGKYRRSAISHFRNIRTKQELTVNDSNPYVRPKRKKRYLPTAWDDISRKDVYNRNWKRHRKKRKQWVR